MAGENIFNSQASGHNAALNGFQNTSFDTDYASYPVDSVFALGSVDAERDASESEFEAAMFNTEQDSLQLVVDAVMFDIEDDTTVGNNQYDVVSLDAEHDTTTVSNLHEPASFRTEYDATVFVPEQSPHLFDDEHGATLLDYNHSGSFPNRVDEHHYRVVESNGMLWHVHPYGDNEESVAGLVDTAQSSNTCIGPSTVNTAVNIIYTPGERGFFDNNTPQDQEREMALRLSEFNQQAVETVQPSQPGFPHVRHTLSNEHPTRLNLTVGNSQNCAGKVQEPFEPAPPNPAVYQHNAQGSMRNAAAPQHPQPVRSLSKMFQCSICGSTKLNSAESLKSHVKKQHINITKHFCEWPNCDFKCTEKKDLQRHINSVHEQSIVYQCPTCGRSFSRKDNCGRHSRKCTTREPGIGSYL